MNPGDQNGTLPRGALYIACGLALFTLAVTATVRITGMGPTASPVSLRAATNDTPVTSRTLRFADRADGAVVITDMKTGTTAHIVAAGEETGFIRGVLRGLARDRRMRGIGDQPPFVLTAWKDGQLTLDDTATGRSIELTAFGSTNRATFAALLPMPKGSGA